jgi:hypothetical protein
MEGRQGRWRIEYKHVRDEGGDGKLKLEWIDTITRARDGNDQAPGVTKYDSTKEN